MKISVDGQKLLSGGIINALLHETLLILFASQADDCMLIIWNLEDGSDQQTISVAFNGPVTSAVWMPVYQEAPNGAFAFGTADGNLFLYTHHKVCFVISTVV